MQTDTVADPAREAPSAAPGARRGRFAGATSIWTAAGLVVLGCLIRIGLIGQGWPATNSDEGFLGVMARHIAYRHERPIFYPGQNYMGPHEAVVGAVLFRLFGESLFMLRFGLVLMFAAFLVSSYLLARLVYGARWALVCLTILALGSPYVMARELTAIGGYGETLLFGALLFLLTSWLVLTHRPYRLLRECRWRLAVYAAWGAVAGTSLWADLLAAPFVLMSGVVLAAVCWREFVRVLAPLVAAAGLVLGMYPAIHYNLHAAPGADTLTALQVVRGEPPATLDAKLHALWNAVRTSVPMMTGEPFCGVNEFPALGPTTSNARSCVLVRDAWGTGYMLLLGVAILLAAWGLWRAWRNRRPAGADRPAPEAEPTRRLRRQAIHAALLASAAITFYLYAFSDAAVEWPGIHARYLIGFVIAAPAVFWPLWQGVTAAGRRPDALRRTVRVACAAVLAAYCAFLAVGTVAAFREVPQVKAGNQRDAALIDTLGRLGVAHIYSDYWVCGKISFLSRERVTCGTVNAGLEGGWNRYSEYWVQAWADPRAAYVFDTLPCRSLVTYDCKDGSLVVRRDGRPTVPVVEEKLRKANRTFQTVTIDGYVIYLPN
ncbi:hypothetical protein [Dactylosporangium sp. CA-092794]|uniref:hypothetical protein n=1 Tax=Dactylosporangium sp. CA-092794 TaxID=3239929 RepID=UPI003D8C6358